MTENGGIAKTIREGTTRVFWQHVYLSLGIQPWHSACLPPAYETWLWHPVLGTQHLAPSSQQLAPGTHHLRHPAPPGNRHLHFAALATQYPPALHLAPGTRYPAPAIWPPAPGTRHSAPATENYEALTSDVWSSPIDPKSCMNRNCIPDSSRTLQFFLKPL